MQVSFPRQPEQINATDFDILRCLFSEAPLWKMEITRRVNQRREGLTLLTVQPVSKQAVAKRINRLHENGIVRKTIIAPSRIDSAVDVRKQFIMAYEPTDRGKELFLEGVVAVFREIISACIGNEAVVADFDGVKQLVSLYGELSGDQCSFDTVVLRELGLE